MRAKLQIRRRNGRCLVQSDISNLNRGLLPYRNLRFVVPLNAVDVVMDKTFRVPLFSKDSWTSPLTRIHREAHEYKKRHLCRDVRAGERRESVCLAPV